MSPPSQGLVMEEIRTTHNRHSRQTHCRNGHELNVENTYISPKSQKRSCKICTAARVSHRRQNEPSFRERVTVNMRTWREANRLRDRKNWTELRKRKKEWLDSQKTACIKCGEADPACLDFHHVDASKKEANLSVAVAHWSISRLQKEMAKCVMLCANCHRKLHASESETANLKDSI